MFANIYLISFVYDVVAIFVFPNKQVKDIFTKNDIIKCHLYLILTDTESASMFVVFVWDIHCPITEAKGIELIFRILTNSKLLERLDLSNKF